MAVGRGNVDGPVAGAADIAGPPRFECLIRSNFGAEVMAAGRTGIHGLAELVCETFSRKVILLLGNPFLEAEMRSNDEFRHGLLRSLFNYLGSAAVKAHTTRAN